MNALDIRSKRDLHDQVEMAACAKKGCLTWEEFLNYFFLRNAPMHDRIDGNDWWTKLDQNGQPVQEEEAREQTMTFALDDDVDGNGDFGGESRFGVKMSRGAKLLKEFKQVPMTPALEFLMKTRRQKVEFDVDDDFRQMQETKATSGPADFMRSSGAGRAKAATANIVD